MGLFERAHSIPQFAQLSVPEQVRMGTELAMYDLRNDPRAQGARAEDLQRAAERRALLGVTFRDDAGFGNATRNLALRYLQGDKGAGASMGLESLTNQLFQSSGILGFLNQVTPLNRVMGSSEDQVRATQFFSEFSRINGTSDLPATIGNVLGTVGDIAVVNTATAGLSGLLGRAGLALTGATRAAEAAAAVGRSAPIVNRIAQLAIPVLADSLVEAVPYFLISEQRAIQQGRPTAWSQGALAVARSLGENALMDFAVGTVATSLLLGAVKVGGIMLRSRRGLRDAMRVSEQLDAIRDGIARGSVDPTVLEEMNHLDAALIRQRGSMLTYVRNPTDVNNLWGRDSLLSNELHHIIENVETEPGSHLFKDYSFDPKTGKPITKTFQNVNELEDHLSTRYYVEQSERLAAAAKSNPKATPEDLFGQFVRPESAWAYQRGRILMDQQARFSATGVLQANPEINSLLKKLPEKWYKIDNRPIVSRAEADAISAVPGTRTVYANVPLQGNVIDAANSGAELRLFKESGPMTVKPHDQPNALFIGVNPAPDDLYKLADQSAADALTKEVGGRNLQQARASVLLNKGFDHYVHPDGSVEFFSPRNAKLIGTPDDLVFDPRKINKTASSTSAGVITESRKVLLKGVTLHDNPDIIALGLKKITTTSDPVQIELFVKGYLNSAGIETPTIKVIRSGESVSILKKGNTLVVRLPKAFGKGTTSPAILRSFVDELNVIAKGSTISPKLKSGSFYFNQMEALNPRKAPLLPDAELQAWAGQVSVKLGGSFARAADGSFSVMLPSGAVSGVDLPTATLWLSRRMTDETQFLNDMALDKIKISKLREGVIARSATTGKVLFSAKTLPDLMDQLDYNPRKLSTVYGPEEVRITPEGFEFTWFGQKAFKNKTEGLKIIGHFQDPKLLTTKRFVTATEAGNIAVDPQGVFTVHLDRLDTHATFETLGAARRFLETEEFTMNTLSSMAHKKFLDFYREGQDFIVVAPDKTFRVKSYREIEEIIGRYPDISESVPDLIKLDPEMESLMPELMNTYKTHRWNDALRNADNQPPEFDLPTRLHQLKTQTVLSRQTSEMFSWFNQAVRQSGFEPLGDQMRDLQVSMRVSQTDTFNAGKRIEAIFSDSKGNTLPFESRQRIFYHLGALQSEADAKMLSSMSMERYGVNHAAAALTPDELKAADGLKEFFNDLGMKFQIDFHKLIFNYIPRLRQAKNALPPDLVNSQIEGLDLASHVPEWNRGVPKEVKFWAEFERTSDMPQYWLKDDAMEVALLYSNQGHKKLYLNPVFQRVNRLFEEASASKLNLDENIPAQWAVFRENIMGTPKTHAEEVLANFGDRFGRALYKSPIGKLFFSKTSEEAVASVTRNWLNNLSSVMYTSSMGWKPWIAVRNIFQVDTMLSMRIGPDWVQRAKAFTLDNFDSVMTKIRARGVATDKLPVVNLLLNRTSRLGRLAESSFDMLKNTDDYTRAVAYTAAEMRFQNAVTLRSITPDMTEARFLTEAGLDRIPQTFTRKALELLAANTPESIEAAADLYSAYITRMTQFDYSGGGTPNMHNGFLGKLFGHFGTYSAGYRANLIEALSYGTLAQRAGSMAIFLASTSALWFAFDQMRIQTSDFIPVAPAIFTGGPLFDVAINAVRSLDTGYEGLKARADLARNIDNLNPIAARLRYGKKVLEAAEAGDSYRAFLSIGMVPVKEE